MVNDELKEEIIKKALFAAQEFEEDVLFNGVDELNFAHNDEVARIMIKEELEVIHEQYEDWAEAEKAKAEARKLFSMIFVNALLNSRRIELESAESGESHVFVPSSEYIKWVFDEALGLADVADKLAWSEQQVNVYRERGQFPEPVAYVTGHPLWLKSQIRRYLEGRLNQES